MTENLRLDKGSIMLQQVHLASISVRLGTIVAAVVSSLTSAVPGSPQPSVHLSDLPDSTQKSLVAEARFWYRLPDGSLWSNKLLQKRNEIYERLFTAKSPSKEILEQVEAMRKQAGQMWWCPIGDKYARSMADVLVSGSTQADRERRAVIASDERLMSLRSTKPGAISNDSPNGIGGCFSCIARKWDVVSKTGVATINLQLAKIDPLSGLTPRTTAISFSYTYSDIADSNIHYNYNVTIWKAVGIDDAANQSVLLQSDGATIALELQKAVEVRDAAGKPSRELGTTRQAGAISADRLLDLLEGQIISVELQGAIKDTTLLAGQRDLLLQFLAEGLRARIRCKDGAPKLDGASAITPQELVDAITMGRARVVKWEAKREGAGILSFRPSAVRLEGIQAGGTE